MRRRAAMLLCCFTAPVFTTAPASAAASAASVGSQAAQPSGPSAEIPREPRRDRNSRQTRDRAQIGVELTGVAPATAVRPTGKASKITIRGTVSNRTGQPLTGVQYRLRYSSQAMPSRDMLGQVADAPVTNLPGGRGFQPLGELGITGKANWRLSAAAKDLGWSREFGAYPVGVEFVTAAGQSLGGQVTFMTFLPGGKKQIKDTTLAWVLPVIDRTHRTDDDTFLDDKLAPELKAEGRLGRLVTAAEKTKTPVTWAIDPALIDDAQRMSSRAGYTVRPPNKKPAHRPFNPAAKEWLEHLRKASARDPYFAVPYADLDADALVRNGMSKHLTAGYQYQKVATDLLGNRASKIGWPASGVSANKTLSAMVKNGTSSFLMSSAVFQPAQTNHTPDASATVPAVKKHAIMYDSVLSDLVSEDTRAPGARVLAQQRFLAETAMITAEQPINPRTIVIAPTRRWNPDLEYAKNVLNWTKSAEWLEPGSVERVAKTEPKEPITYKGYPDAYTANELGRTYLTEVNRISTRATRFGEVLVPKSLPYEKAVLRMESASWRGSGAQARAQSARAELRNRLDDDIEKVHVVLNKRTTQLAGRTGRIPISVTNRLPNKQGMRVSLQIRITSVNRQKLQVGRYESSVVLDPGGETATVLVEIKSFAQGTASLKVDLLTPADQVYRPSETVTVNTTGYGPIAVLITGGGLAVLFVGVGFRVLRARRRNQMEAAGDGSPGGEQPWGTGPGNPAPH